MGKKSVEYTKVLKRIGVDTDLFKKEEPYQLENGSFVILMYSKYYIYQDVSFFDTYPGVYFFRLLENIFKDIDKEKLFFLFICELEQQVLIVPATFLSELLNKDTKTVQEISIYNKPGSSKFEFYVSGKPRKDVSSYLNRYDLLNINTSEDHELPNNKSDNDREDIKIDNIANVEASETQVSEHLRMQYLLVKIGIMEGHDVWVASNDKNKEYKNEKFAEFCLAELPRFSSSPVLKVAELIDVIWFEKNTAKPVHFFEIEHTTLIYPGLLRLNDVRIDYPIPEASIVADEVRGKLFENQINRRTFSKSEINNICQFLSYKEVEKWYESLKNIQGIRKKH